MKKQLALISLGLFILTALSSHAGTPKGDYIAIGFFDAKTATLYLNSATWEEKAWSKEALVNKYITLQKGPLQQAQITKVVCPSPNQIDAAIPNISLKDVTNQPPKTYPSIPTTIKTRAGEDIYICTE